MSASLFWSPTRDAENSVFSYVWNPKQTGNLYMFPHSYWTLGNEAFWLLDWQPSQQPLHYQHTGVLFVFFIPGRFTPQNDFYIGICGLIYIMCPLTRRSFLSFKALSVNLEGGPLLSSVDEPTDHRCQLCPASRNLKFCFCRRCWRSCLKFSIKNCRSVMTRHVNNLASAPATAMAGGIVFSGRLSVRPVLASMIF